MPGNKPVIMQVLDKKTIEHIASLARHHISGVEAQEYSQQLTKVLNYFEQISKVDTNSVEPLVTPTDIKSYWREDSVAKNTNAEDILANAPQRTGNLFTVPPVVGG